MPFLSTHQHLPRRLPREDQHCAKRANRSGFFAEGNRKTCSKESQSLNVIHLVCQTHLLLYEETLLVTVGHVDVMLWVKQMGIKTFDKRS